jgi:hypothetical protein
VLHDYEPESRKYGELPVRIGEEVWVSGGECEGGWIFGVKRGLQNVEEGWLPARAVGLGIISTSDEEESDTDARAKVYNGHSKEQGGDVEPWHHHGNWWSKQRHLRSDKVVASTGGAYAADDWHQQQVSWKSKSGNGGNYSKAATTEEWAEYSWEEFNQMYSYSGGKHTSKSKRGGGGHAAEYNNAKAATRDPPRNKKSSKDSQQNQEQPAAAAATARPVRERQARVRPALTSLLDRLNKPLERPAKPVVVSASTPPPEAATSE